MSIQSIKREIIQSWLEPLTFEDIEYLYEDQGVHPDITYSHDELKADLLERFVSSGHSFRAPFVRLDAAKEMKEYLRVVKVVESLSSSLSEEDKKSILFSMSFHCDVLNSHLDP